MLCHQAIGDRVVDRSQAASLLPFADAPLCVTQPDDGIRNEEAVMLTS
jgi:hypothetical protein